MTAAPADRVRGRLADKVCRRLADEIVLGYFEPGARLDETMLARRLSVSRTPVREVLRQFAITGLIVCRPNRGSVVAGLDPDQLDVDVPAVGDQSGLASVRAAKVTQPFRTFSFLILISLN